MSDLHIPESFPTVQIDDMLSTIDIVCDLQIHAVLYFSTKVDEERLQKAVRLSIDSEPVLGCHLKHGWWKQKWQRCHNDKLDQAFTAVNSKNHDKDIDDYMTRPYDMYSDSALNARLFRGEKDSICIKLSHIALDGGGTKEYLKLLISIYNNLKENPNYTPKINISGSRDFSQVTNSFSKEQKVKRIGLHFRDYFKNIFPIKNWQLPALGKSKDSKKIYITHILNPTLIKENKALASDNKLTLTDVLMAAVYRSLFKTLKPSEGTPLKLGTTVDMRHYLPRKKSAALCNLSAAFNFNIGNDIGKSLIDTAKKINAEMIKHKNEGVGLGDNRYAIFDTGVLPFSFAKGINIFHQIFKFIIGTKKVPPMLTYVGKLDHTLRGFKNEKVTRAYISAPIAYSPVFFICLTGYNSEFILCSGFKGSTEDEQLVKDLFLLVEKELSNAVSLEPTSDERELAKA